MGIEKLFRESYKTLSSQWGNAIGATLIFTFIVAVLSFIGGIISIFLELLGISYLYAQLLGNNYLCSSINRILFFYVKYFKKY